MSFLRKGLGVLQRAAVRAVEILDDGVRSAIFRSGGLPTAFYCVVLAVAVYAALYAP